MTISEVLLSVGGDDSIQYVELFDFAASGESFPDSYQLVIYDPNGDSLGSVAADPPSGTTRFLVATAAADAEFGSTRDETLTVALPPAGQVCFEETTGLVIACARWGCVDTAIDPTYTDGAGAAPPDGMSLGRQLGDGSYTVGDPTPGEPNEAGTAEVACPGAPDAGTGAADAGPDDDVDGGTGGADGGGGGGGADDDDSGCGCAVNRPGAGASSFAAIALALAFSFRRRRRA